MSETPQTPAAFAAEPAPNLPPPHRADHEQKELPFRFTGSAGEYFRIWIVNVLLTVLTLGIYSAWAKVRNKQYFYRHTWLEDASFEYLANPIGILKGRLIIGAVFVAIAVTQHYAPVLYLLLMLFVMLSTPWVLVKSLSFNARNSAYRNVRLGFKGTVGDSYGAYLVGLAIYMVTCGFGMPYMQWRITQFAVDSHRWGTLSFRWRTQMGDYIVAFLIAMAIGVPIVIFMYLGLFGMMGAAVAMGSEGGDAGATGAMGVGFMAFFFLLYSLFIIPEAYLKTKIANLMWGGISIGPHELNSNQEFREVLMLQVTNILGVVCSLGLAVPWAKVRSYRYRVEHLTAVVQGSLEVAAGRAGETVGAYGDAASDLGDFDLDFG